MRSLRQKRGQVALEVLVVIAAWWVLIVVFINVMIALSSMMVVQSTVNRLAVQVGAMGCYPKRQFENELNNTLGGFAIGPTAEKYQITRSYWKITPPTSPGDAPLTENPPTPGTIPDCVERTSQIIDSRESYVPSNSYVTVTLRYQQRLFFIEDRVNRSATTVSSRLEPEG